MNVIERPLLDMERRLRRAIRRHPRVHVALLDALGVVGVPVRPGIYFLCWHSVPADRADEFVATLSMLSEHGRFVSWTDALDALAGPDEIDEPRFCLTFDDGDTSWVDVVVPALTARGLPATFFIVTSLVGADGRPSLTWDDCRMLASLGMTIGSHSTTHRALSELDDSSAWAEMAESKAVLEDRLGVPVLDFCAPFGQPGVTYRPERDPGLAATIGYRSFVTTTRGRMLAGDSAYGVRRMTVDSDWPTAAVRGLIRM